MKLRISKKLVFIICSCALIYQSIDLYIDYKKYQTIVTVNIEKQSAIEFPGISLCFNNPYINLSEQSEDHKLSKIPIPEGIWMRAKHRDPEGLKRLIASKPTWKNAAKFFLNQSLTMKDAFEDEDVEESVHCEIS